jgi:hypothetical protein
VGGGNGARNDRAGRARWRDFNRRGGVAVGHRRARKIMLVSSDPFRMARIRYRVPIRGIDKGRWFSIVRRVRSREIVILGPRILDPANRIERGFVAGLDLIGAVHL